MLKLLYALIIAAFLCLLVLASPAVHADGWQDKLAPTASLIGSLEGGPTLGVCASWEVAEVADLPLYADLFLKRNEGATDGGGGVSTEAFPMLDRFPLVRVVVPLLDRVFPDGTCVGFGYLVDANESWWYARSPLKSF